MEIKLPTHSSEKSGGEQICMCMKNDKKSFWLMDAFHISGALRSGNHHSWINFYSVEPNFAFAFSVVKEKSTILGLFTPELVFSELSDHAKTRCK